MMWGCIEEMQQGSALSCAAPFDDTVPTHMHAFHCPCFAVGAPSGGVAALQLRGSSTAGIVYTLPGFRQYLVRRGCTNFRGAELFAVDGQAPNILLRTQTYAHALTQNNTSGMRASQCCRRCWSASQEQHR